jgi:hypothetical protein
MAEIDRAPRRGWRGRVAFARDGRRVAFAPGSALIPADRVDEVLPRRWRRDSERSVEGYVPVRLSDIPRLGDDPDAAEEAAAETLDLVDDLRTRGIAAQPDHILFADHDPECGEGGEMSGNPFSANPFSANPFSANGWPPEPVESSGERPSLALPADPLPLPAPTTPGADSPVVLVLDTGLPEANDRPPFIQHATSTTAHDTKDVDDDQRLDPAAGHGAFIAGIISRIAPHTRVIVEQVLTSFGDGKESVVADVLSSYAGNVDLVNLSFGTYTPFCPRPLARAVRAVQKGIVRDENSEEVDVRPAVVVASAGNDATWAPAFPARLPGVVSVAALDRWGPAAFSNYGPWVRACAPGTDVVSTFFLSAKTDAGAPFRGWASWSGTSFAAPHVVGALARRMVHDGITARQAVRRVIDAPGLMRIPAHGTVVNVS